MSDTASVNPGQDSNAPSSSFPPSASASFSSIAQSSTAATEATTATGATTAATTTSAEASSTATPFSTSSSATFESSRTTNSGTSVTASSTANQQLSSTSSPSNKGVSTGALAGSIVGAFLGGCLLAFLLAALYFRKRKQKRDTADSPRGSTLSSSKPKGQSDSFAHPQYESAISYTTKDDVKFPTAAGTAILPGYLPPPADDGMVAMKIQTLFDQIGLHVENFYIRLPSNTSLQSERADAIAQYDSSLAPTSLIALLSNGKTQRSGLTHALAYYVLEAIRPGSEGSTLLPPCFRWRHEPLPRGVADPDQDNAIFTWRMLISHLNDRNSDFSSRNQSEISSLAQHFTSTFSPYKNSEFSDSDRVTHLISLMKAASGLGAWLFAQPCLFEFDWKTQNADVIHDQLVVFPMVVKICDEQGRRLEVSQKIVEAQVMKI